MKPSRLHTLEERWPLERLKLLDLYGRPFLHEQGNTVTRGFVRFLEVDDAQWQLNVTEVEYLDKSNGVWLSDIPEAAYGGTIEHAYAIRYWAGLNPIFDVGIQISGYGIFVYIGVSTESPWSDNDWPELDTEWLDSGPMAN